MTIFLVALFGGVLGICFMVLLRQALIVEEHGTLPFPEGTAAQKFFLQEKRRRKSSTVFAGLGIAAYKFIADGFKLFWRNRLCFQSYAGSQIGIQVLPAAAVSASSVGNRRFQATCLQEVL